VIRVTADTNVLVSGLMFQRGKPFEFLRMAVEGEIAVAVSPPIISEMLNVLDRKFGIGAREVNEYWDTVRAATRLVHPTLTVDVVHEDRDDNKILECAVAAGSQYLVTGDKHLLRLRQYEGIQIVTVSDFLDIAKSQGRER
jgi:uncharacterized protein